jgi:hypothetical protein
MAGPQWPDLVRASLLGESLDLRGKSVGLPFQRAQQLEAALPPIGIVKGLGIDCVLKRHDDRDLPAGAP